MRQSDFVGYSVTFRLYFALEVVNACMRQSDFVWTAKWIYREF